MATTRPPRRRAARDRRGGRSRECDRARRTAGARSSAASPVDEMPAAWVSVAKPTPRSRSAPSSAQSSTKPADGGSKATGSAGDRRPHVPQRERLRHVRVLDRPAVPRDAGPDRVGRRRRSAARPAADGRAARIDGAAAGRAASRSPACSGGGGGRSSVRVRWSPAPNTTAVNSRTSSAAQRAPAGEPHLDRRAARRGAAVQAGRQRRGVVGDDQVAGPQQLGESRARHVRDAAVGVDDEQPRVARPLHGPGGGVHGVAPPASICADAAPSRRRCGDRVGDLARGVVRPLQRRRIGVGHRERVQRRVHVARIERQDARRRAAASSSSQMRLR